MLRLELPRRTKGPLQVLCLGAHSDDLEIGCGGTILDLIQRRRPLEVRWVVFSGNAIRAKEARASARALLRGARSRIETKQFRDGFFPAQTARLKEEFERLKRRARPDLIFCPWRGDAHQDHRLLAELAWNTFRDHLILEYEIPKYDGDLSSPNLLRSAGEETVPAARSSTSCGPSRPRRGTSGSRKPRSGRSSGSAGSSAMLQNGQAEAFYCPEDDPLDGLTTDSLTHRGLFADDAQHRVFVETPGSARPPPQITVGFRSRLLMASNPLISKRETGPWSA